MDVLRVPDMTNTPEWKELVWLLRKATTRKLVTVSEDNTAYNMEVEVTVFTDDEIAMIKNEIIKQLNIKL